MKWIKILVFIVGFWSVTASEARAQIDTLFYFAAPWVTPDHWWRDPIEFQFATFGNDTEIRLRQPAGTYDTTFTVLADDYFNKEVTHLMNMSGNDSLECKPADIVLDYGFEITSDFPITVVYNVITRASQFFNPETYSLKGQNGIGYEFITPYQTLWRNRTLTGDLNGDGEVTQPKQQFSVIATEDNTTIWITPACEIVGPHPAGVSFSVTLDFAGQVYTAENITQFTQVYGQNMAGSIISADKPVSVVVSDDSVNPSGGGGCYDLMGDQIVPVDVIGQEYIVNRGFLNTGSNESLFVLATENFTEVTVDDGTGPVTTLLNQGDTYPYSVTEPLTYINADKPVYLWHMSGYGCELGAAILPPLNCAGSDTVRFSRNNTQQFLLNILVPAGSEGDFELNGNPALIPPGAFAAVPGTGGAWMGAQINYSTAEVPVGASVATNSSSLFSLGIINGGPTTGGLYHYLSSFLRRVFVDAGNDTTLCTGSGAIDLDGSVQGGTTTGIWNAIDGTGSIDNDVNLSTFYNPTVSDFSQGFVTFVLQSTGNCDPVYDTLVVSFEESPVVDAGLEDSYCKNNVSDIPLNGSLTFAVGSEWSGGVGGSFDDISDLTTTYTPSPTDLANDSVVIYLTSSGAFFSCPEDEDSVVIYFTDPPNVFAGPDIVTCASDSSVALSGVVSGASSTGIWSGTGSGAFDPSETDLINDYLLSSADTTAGSVVIYLTSTANGDCLAVTDSLLVTILDQPQLDITTSDSICANATFIDLTGTVTSGFSTDWNTSGFGTVADPSSLATTYTFSPLDTIGGSMWIYLSTVGGICPVENDSMELFFIAPPIADAGPDMAFCSNEPAPLEGLLGGSAASGSWSSLGTGFFSPSADLLNTFYVPSSLDVTNGSVELIFTTDANFGCIADADTIEITYLEPPQADFSYEAACEGQNTIFTDLTTVSSGSVIGWEWDFGGTGTSIAQNPNHPYPGSGTYNVTLISEGSNGCFDTIVKTVWVNPEPIPAFNSNFACIGEPVFFIDNSFISPGAITNWEWDFNSGEGSSSLEDPTFTFDEVGTFPVNLTVTSDSGCVGMITEDVDVLSGPTADFEVNPSPALALEDVSFTDLSTGGPFTSWLWDFGDGEFGNSQNEIHQYENGGTYTIVLEVVDTAGCRDAAAQDLEIVLLPQLPTAFTPNGDGENDVFIIRGGPFESTNFRIYNNWGQVVFTTTDATIGWDGTFAGKDAQVGVYTWTFEITISGDRVVIKEGDVTLIR